ncbi:Ig-like domain-containing protein [Sphingomonas sp. MMS24-JH45]
MSRTFNVQSVNDLPTTQGVSLQATEGGALQEGRLMAQDVDQQELTFVANGNGPPDHAESDGSYALDPTHPALRSYEAGVTTKYDFIYTVEDTSGGKTEAFLSVAITGIANGPTGAPTAKLAAARDMAYVVSDADLLAGFSGDGLHVVQMWVEDGTVERIDGGGASRRPGMPTTRWSSNMKCRTRPARCWTRSRR